MLRTLGDELDPQERRQAEAFAYEGRMPTQTSEERAAADAAVAVATGRGQESDAVTRRLRNSTSHSSVDAEERRRLGREYLARKNQQMWQMKQKKAEAEKNGEASTPLDEKSSTFEDMVNSDGTLRADALPSPPTEEPQLSEKKALEVESAAQASSQTLGSGISGLQAGSRYANPFGDEFELSEPALLDRSITPKPPVPPKIALQENEASNLGPSNLADLRSGSGSGVPPSIQSYQEQMRQLLEANRERLREARAEHLKETRPQAQEDLSYEEQLARALSLSLAESEAAARSAREANDPDIAAAIAASLRESAPSSPATPRLPAQAPPLVDLTPSPPISVPSPSIQQNAYHRALSSPATPPPPAAMLSPQHTDELYSLSPQYMRATPVRVSSPLQSPHSPQSSQFHFQSSLSSPFDHVHDDQSHTLSPATLSRNISAATSEAAGAGTGAETTSQGFATDSEDEFASLSASHSSVQSWDRALPVSPRAAPSTSPSRGFADDSQQQRRGSGNESGTEGSIVQVEDLDMESVDSEDGDGVLTPGSWTDVGSVADEGEVMSERGS